MSAKELIAEVRRLDAFAPKGPWIRAWFEDGEPGEGPYGVHPGSRGDMVESDEVITRPTEEEPDGQRVCECANDTIADFVFMSRTLLPALADELEAALAREASAQATNETLADDADRYFREVTAEREAHAATKARLDKVTGAARRAVAAFFADPHTADDATCAAMVNLRDIVR